jgi:pimeloyl-ACP methyl ester carboxylesterase
MNGNNILLIFVALFLSISLGSCGNDIQATDYAKPEHWLSVPVVVDKVVDVFYLYPTSWQKVNQSDPNICEIDNPIMLKYAKFAFQRQATAFEIIANIYAPYYRQDDAAYTTSLPQAEQANIVGGIPKTDAIAAFDYYIKNYNNGRPFILVGHSQGSIVMMLILSEYMKENPKVYARMIAAYVIGASITPEYLAENPHLKFAEGPDDTGVIISYNTEAPTVEGKSPVLVPGALAINPITWTRNETFATAEQNLGSIALNKDGSVVLDNNGKIVPIKNYADARVDKARGVIICSICDVEKLAPGTAFSGKGVFHSFDYSFYYFNIRENADIRAKNFFGQH